MCESLHRGLPHALIHFLLLRIALLIKSNGIMTMKALLRNLFVRSRRENHKYTAPADKSVSLNDLKALDTKTLRDIGVKHWQILMGA